MSTDHPSKTELEQFTLGHCRDADGERIGGHVVDCSACQAALDEIGDDEDGLFHRLHRLQWSGTLDLTTDVAMAQKVGFDGLLATAGVRIGEQLGNFRLLRELGRGGMGVVFEAEDQVLRRRVALKLLALPPGSGATLVERFRREARAAAGLHHTNIVQVFEVSTGEPLWYAMQLITGSGLDRIVERLRAAAAGHPGTAPLPVGWTLEAYREGQPYFRTVAEVGRQVAEALAHAHTHGITHRDIKPSNLLLDEGGTVWVADFGLAKVEDDALTQSNELLGTLRYMAPERFEGRCDGRADTYALGLVLYELCTLRPAFDASDQLQLLKALQHEPTRPQALDPRIPLHLETIILKASDRNPQRRYATAADMAEDLRRFLADEPIHARPPGISEKVVKFFRRHPGVGMVVLTALSLAVMVLVVAASAWLNRPITPSKSTVEPADPPKRDVDGDLWEAAVRKMEPAEQAGAIANELKKRHPDFDTARFNYFIDNGEQTVHIGNADMLRDLSPLRAMTGLKRLILIAPSYNGPSNLAGLRGLQLTHLHLTGCRLTDISPLEGMPLTSLNLWRFEGNSDRLLALRGMPLTNLNIGGSLQIKDLSPLRGLPLETLTLHGTPVEDLSQLGEMPLKDLHIEMTSVKDFTFLKKFPLRRLRMSDPTKHAALLRSIPTLETINGKRVAEVLGNAP